MDNEMTILSPEAWQWIAGHAYNDENLEAEMIKQEDDCGRLIDGICELGYQVCALTMYHPIH